jgi:hypothetical protein
LVTTQNRIKSEPVVFKKTIMTQTAISANGNGSNKRPPNERKWVAQVLSGYDAIEKLQPKSFDSMVNAWPDWVVKLWVVLFGVSHPGLNVRNHKKWTARDLGRFLGRQNALARLAWGEVPLSPRVEEESERWIDAESDRICSNPKLASSSMRIEKRLHEWRPVFDRYIDETLASARKRPYPESSAFLEAFGKANVINPDDLATERTMGVGDKIAYVMIAFWQPIAKFQSVAQVHQFVSAAAKPAGIVITLKRVEKLCQRIGLKFKGRGRPKGKIQTNAPAVS